jgi:hypothetical protein
MALPWDKREFESWSEALNRNELNDAQLNTLREMVSGGLAASLPEAAKMLDWQEAVIDTEEHMHGL